MTIDTMTLLQLNQTRTTPIMLELANKPIVRPTRILEDVIVTMDSWEYMVDFALICPKTIKL